MKLCDFFFKKKGDAIIIYLNQTNRNQAEFK